jgi:hypothetical protein
MGQVGGRVRAAMRSRYPRPTTVQTDNQTWGTEMEIAQLAVAIVGLSGVGFGIWSGLKRLNHSTAVASSSFLLQLDDAFVRHEDAKRNLRPGGKWWKEGVDRKDRAPGFSLRPTWVCSSEWRS